ncbi:phosphoribosylanthranilate isomerase [Maritalea porphyrae]|jgi:phosphoribosylanthranilate isomerase|uniref:phosphoribosylanthranilate isomerase n=1 Tax=Maritalea porphyrae TaxID=880732 RepID=UPI0022AE96A1|nr:phosphoribosylanthranilate isomerase [Maritalea porphyrae]MCZ4271993.1 phosphoribosylanthranilate isomerase [Maritalea porphyrae]
MQLQIKICGLKSKELVDVAVNAGADLIGFVHFAKSPRHLELEQIGELINYIGARAQSVVLTVNPSDQLIEQINQLRPHYIQLHGNESLERIQEVKAKSHAKLIKALPVADVEDLEQIGQYHPLVDWVLLDAKPPKDATRPGGNGEVFDWSILKALDPTIPFMLSGGLNVENVADAVKQIQPAAIDVSSGVERTKGEKDAEKIRRFISQATIASV